MADPVAWIFDLLKNQFSSLAYTDIQNFFKENKVSEHLLENLSSTLHAAKHLYNVAEEKQFGKLDEGVRLEVREWLFKLLDSICNAEDFVEMMYYKTLQYKHENELGITSRIPKRLRRIWKESSKSFDDEVKEIHEKLECIMKQKETYGIIVGVDKKTQMSRLPTPFAEESKVFGRKDDKETIISRLLSDNSNGDKITVIPIVGMGGVGKTTLARLVYEDDRVKSHFNNISAWVTVSEDFDILKIMRTIFKDITSKECDSDNLDQLSRKIREELKEKKFVIVLDDIWNENGLLWDSLKSHFQFGACGSKIIVTTRSKKVAQVMKSVEPFDLKELSNDDCQRLFEKLVFGNSESDSFEDLRKIGREIVRKCKGLPLAIKALAGLLGSIEDREEWQKILRDDIWEKTSNNILPSLWFSYSYLPSHIKPCFVYFSIFPKGFEITEHQKKEIILLWMAEGLLQPDISRRKTAIQVGYEYFDNLLSMSLLQQSSKSRTIIVMHDCVHDLASFLSGEFCFRSDDNNKTKLFERTRHFSYPRDKEYQNFGDLSVAKNLRTYLQIPLAMKYMRLQQKEPIIPTGEFLRALCLSDAHLTVFPDSVCNLKLLRYLDLSRNVFEKIPDELCSLYFMQTLRLSYCEKLIELPTDMGNLVNLCCLDIEGVPLNKMPPQMCNLKNLETLSQFVVGKNKCSNIKELEGLCQLSGKLAIKNLQNVDDVDDVKVANLQAKEYLNEIEYQWGSDDEAEAGAGAGHSQKERLVLDALQPHTNVKEIVISGYSGEEFSKWVGNDSYANIATVNISTCKSCLLPPLGQLPCLEKLSITGCNKVTEIGHGFYRERHSRIEPFRSLKLLEFNDMLNWTTWSFLEGVRDGCFPCLEELSIQRCPNLKISFPYCFPKLKRLFIGAMEQNFLLLPENQKIVEAFPYLEVMSMENCHEILNSSSFWKSFPDITSLLFSTTYPENTISWNAGSPSDLHITNCENMVSLPKADISTVTSINIRGLENLEALGCEDFQHFTSLKELVIEHCNKLCRFPGEMLPTSLTSLKIEGLPSLQDVGNGFQHLTSLEDLTVANCKDLRCLTGEMLPTSLTSLEIRRLPSLKDVGNGFQHLTSLKDLSVQGCKDLQCLTGEMLPTSLTRLSINEIPNIKDLHKGFEHLTSLKDFCLMDIECFNVEILPKSLTYLAIYNLQKLEESVEGIRHLTSLERLRIFHFLWGQSSSWQLFCLQQWLPTSLTSLHIVGLQNLKSLCKSARDLISLEELNISYCENLECLASEDGNGFQDLTSLKSLTIQRCDKLTSLLERGLPTTLTYLDICSFENLEDLNQVGIHHLVSLERLRIRYCKNLQRLPEEGLPKCLSKLDIGGCPLLIPRCERDVGQDWHKIAHIPRVYIMEEDRTT